ncbi:MAG: hypothetical protein KatS3mg102_2961 [Planctomycetota bacterium]|nr:MAG: hypothetical protein KatS3mg102_2961 [Planctomycetota bacterium]
MQGEAQEQDRRPAGEPEQREFTLAELFAPPAASGAGAEQPAPPAAEPGPEQTELYRQVEAVLDELRPYIQMDGGDIELLGIEDGVVRVRMHGACVGCSASMYTLQLGVEQRLRETVPGIRYVEAVEF